MQVKGSVLQTVGERSGDGSLGESRAPKVAMVFQSDLPKWSAATFGEYSGAMSRECGIQGLPVLLALRLLNSRVQMSLKMRIWHRNTASRCP